MKLTKLFMAVCRLYMCVCIGNELNMKVGWWERRIWNWEGTSKKCCCLLIKTQNIGFFFNRDWNRECAREEQKLLSIPESAESVGAEEKSTGMEGWCGGVSVSVCACVDEIKVSLLFQGLVNIMTKQNDTFNLCLRTKLAMTVVCIVYCFFWLASLLSSLSIPSIAALVLFVSWLLWLRGLSLSLCM